MTSESTSSAQRQFRIDAGVLAFLWPGLGHIRLGHARRGRLIMLGVLFLFVSGLLIGGLDSIDRVEDDLWFLAQACCGPVTFVADFLNQNVVKQLPEDQRMFTIGLNKPNEMGTLFCALAGLMNFMVILDALYFYPRMAVERRRDQGSGIRD